MRNILLLLVASVTFLCGAARAAEPSAAQTRAAHYQSEVRAAFARQGWWAVEDRPGRLEVEHGLRSLTVVRAVYAPGKTFAHLTIVFQPDSATHTATSATAARYIRGSRPGRLDYPPFALHNPEVTRAYLDALGQAEARLAASHPQHGAPSGHPVDAKDRSGQFAMN